MTRTVVYGASMAALIAATAMTLTSIYLPNWVSWNVSSSTGTPYTKTIGLHKSCSSTTTACKPFPTYEDCPGDGTDRYFCSMWRTMGFMMWIAAVVELVSLVGFVIVIAGGKSKREQGWKVLPALLLIVGALQCASMSILAYLFDNDDRFFVGWRLDTSWILCTISWCVAMLAATFLFFSPYIFASEGDYELIPSERTPLVRGD